MDIQEYLKQLYDVNFPGNAHQIRIPQDITKIDKECFDFLKSVRKSDNLIINKSPSKIINIDWNELDYPFINIQNCDIVNDVVFKGMTFNFSGTGSEESENIEKINYDIDSENIVLKWALNTKKIKIGSTCKTFKMYNSTPIEIDLSNATNLEELEFFNFNSTTINMKLSKTFIDIKHFYCEENKNRLGIGDFYMKYSKEAGYDGAKDAYNSGLFEFKN